VSTSDSPRSKTETLFATQTTAAHAPDPGLVTVCDWLAASPVDEQRPKSVPGILPEQINVAPALAACNEAVSRYPNIARFPFELGRVLSSSNDYSAAREQFNRAADLGSAAAMNNIGALYANGRGVTQDYAEAKRWYEQAAAAGSSFAMNNLGNLYLNGNG